MTNGSKLTIWGRDNSINVMKVLWACQEVSLPYERVDLGGAFGGTGEPGYLAMNPNGRVPTIRDGDTVLWESNVCVRYLARTYGKPGLWPADGEARWRAEQWMDWQQTTLGPDLRPVFWQLVRTPAGERDPAVIEASRQACAKQVAVLDAHLGRYDFVAGPVFSMGDIPVGSAIYRWLALDIERPAAPNVERWYQRLAERDGYRKHVMKPLT